jgi:hypothetical protein
MRRTFFTIDPFPGLSYDKSNLYQTEKETVMGKIGRTEPVMLFTGMLSGDSSLMNRMTERLIEHFGPLAEQTEDLHWRYTDYYAEELGRNVFRRFLFFKNLISPDRIAGIKVETNRMEERNARKGAGRSLRRINLDPGYMELSKVVLASTKNYSHRIYLSHGIYAEVTLKYVRGSFRSLDHTYPDYGAEKTIEIFNRMRKALAPQQNNKPVGFRIQKQ